MLLPALLGSGIPSSFPALFVITDSLLQPGLLLLRQLIVSSLARNEPVVLLTLEQTPSRLLPTQYDTTNVDLPVPSPALSSATDDWDAEVGLQKLQRSVLESITKRQAQGGPVLVVLDSVDELATFGVPAAFAFLKALLRELSPTSRLATLHHNHFPALPSSSPTVSPSLLPTLLSPTLSSATVHLTLHPSSLLELFSREYGLTIPTSSTSTIPLDVRLPAFLISFAARSFGAPWIRPISSREEDERIPLDGLGKRDGGCVVEWSCRGVGVPGEGPKRGEVKKVLVRGMEGLRRTREGVEGVRLGDVLNSERMAHLAISDPELPVPPKPTTPLLPFNLSLTDSQRAARENVVLPYLPREAEIEYVPDEGDDLDDDDPDEDLEI